MAIRRRRSYDSYLSCSHRASEVLLGFAQTEKGRGPVSTYLLLHRLVSSHIKRHVNLTFRLCGSAMPVLQRSHKYSRLGLAKRRRMQSRGMLSCYLAASCDSKYAYSWWSIVGCPKRLKGYCVKTYVHSCFCSFCDIAFLVPKLS